jgi:uncharacterized protein (TIGR00369 family)
MADTIWKKSADIDLMNSISADTMVSQIGISYTEIGEDFIVATMPVDSRTHQPFGLLHGGASAALIETLGSVAANLAVEEDEYCVGIEINANHLSAKRDGIVTGTARPVHLGGTIHVWSVDIVDDSDKLISTGRITLAVRKTR